MDEESRALIEANQLTDKQYNDFLLELIKIPTSRAPIDGKIAVLAFEFMEDTGCRITETLHIRKQDLNFKNRILTVIHPKSEKQCKCSKWKYKDEYTRNRILESSNPNCPKCKGKGKWKKPQRTTFTPRLTDRLLKYCETLPDDESLLFPVTRKTMWVWGKKAGINAGLNIFQQKEERLIEGIFLHLFRALCSKRMIKDGKYDDYKDQMIATKLRHSFKEVTDRYTKIDINYLIGWENKTYSEIPDLPGIYYLYEEENLMYIGKSIHLKTRIDNHRASNKTIIEYMDLVESKSNEELIDITDFLLIQNINAALNSQRIDLVFDRVTEIKHKLIDKDNLDSFELKEIEKHKPLFNNGYYEYDAIDDIIQKWNDVKIQKVKDTI
jgi:integrase